MGRLMFTEVGVEIIAQICYRTTEVFVWGNEHYIMCGIAILSSHTAACI